MGSRLIHSEFHPENVRRLSRRLIVNADDFGLSAGINDGIMQAHLEGIVTSASLMVRHAAAEDAAAKSRRHPRLSVGLHLDFGEWFCRDGAWIPLYEVVPLDDRTSVAAEVARQIDLFRSLTGRNPTHLDSHQHVHREEPLRSIAREAARDLAVPLRHFNPKIRYCGSFYGQDADGSPLTESISTAALLGIISALPASVTELGCHPGLGDETGGMYRSERAEEVKVLCDPAVRAAISDAEIELCSFDIFRELQVSAL